MSLLTITSVDALGHATPRESVTITLTDVDGVAVEQATAGGSAVIRKAAFALDDDGTGSVDLTPNSEITPANTVYTVQLGDTVWTITKGSGEENLVDIAAAPAELGTVLGIAGLADVDVAGLADGEVLVWDETAEQWVPGAGGGAVASVNAQTGAVTLDATDVGADPAGTAATTATPARSRGVKIREPLTTLGTAWDNARTTPGDVVVIGDSIQVYNGAQAWPFITANALAQVVGSRRPGSSYVASKTLALPAQFTTSGGTDNTSTTASYGRTWTTGQKGTLPVTADGISVVYSTTPAGTGTLTVRDGVAGTVLGTISNDAAASAGRVWTSGALTRGARTFEFENTGAGSFVIDQALPHDGNRTGGVRVWNASRSGGSAADFVTNPTWGLHLITNLQPDAVVIQFGTNGTDHLTNHAALIAAVRAAAPSTQVIGVVPYENSSITWTEIEDIRTVLDANADVTIDLPTLMPRAIQQGLISGDNVHPENSAAARMGLIIATYLSADPLALFAALFTQRASLNDTVQQVFGPISSTQIESGGTYLTGASGVLRVKGLLAELLGSAADGTVNAGHLSLTAQTTGATPASGAVLNVNASGQLVVKFANGTTKTIADNT